MKRASRVFDYSKFACTCLMFHGNIMTLVSELKFQGSLIHSGRVVSAKNINNIDVTLRVITLIISRLGKI